MYRTKYKSKIHIFLESRQPAAVRWKRCSQLRCMPSVRGSTEGQRGSTEAHPIEQSSVLHGQTSCSSPYRKALTHWQFAGMQMYVSIQTCVKFTRHPRFSKNVILHTVDWLTRQVEMLYILYWNQGSRNTSKNLVWRIPLHFGKLVLKCWFVHN